STFAPRSFLRSWSNSCSVFVIAGNFTLAGAGATFPAAHAWGTAAITVARTRTIDFISFPLDASPRRQRELAVTSAQSRTPPDTARVNGSSTQRPGSRADQAS